MFIAIFSDIHGNLPALERFVGLTKAKADGYVCLGDVVNYGPWNDECLELVEGNHERLFLGLDPIENEVSLVQEFYHYSVKHFSRRDLIASLPVDYGLGSFLCTHTIDQRRVYADTDIEVTRDHVIGHTHHQFRIERSGKTVVNSGSIGQNRDNADELNYVLFDTTSNNIRQCTETYPLDVFIGELVSRGYSQRCIDYYLAKRK
jgi:predicted phosphodiesterase